MNTENDKEEEYIPPGKRLITPADVVEIDPSMTVLHSVSIFYLLGVVPRWYTGV